VTSRRLGRRQRYGVACTGWVVTVAAVAMVIFALTAGGGPPAPAHLAATPTPTSATTIPSTPTTPAPPTTSSAPVALPRSTPVALRIPAIGVASTVIDVGLNPDHTLQVPPLDAAGTHEAAWYDLSPTPGQIGPAVIVGHVDSAAGEAVFYRLGSLRAGNKILVTRADHTTATFTVTSVNQYPKTRFPTQAVYGHVNQPALRLITCGGTFDHTTGHYLSNTVVYATIT